MKSIHDQVTVSELPQCAFTHNEFIPCGSEAKYDARLRACANTWAYVCQFHFDFWECKLGLGHGQKLTLTTERE